MSVGDVRVVGMMAGTHVIEDIGMDVPHGATITIPAAKAHVSKDLWRAISQRCLFHLAPGPMTQGPASPTLADVEALREQVRVLTEANLRLQAKLAARETELAARDTENPSQKLDAILALLQSGTAPSSIAVAGVARAPARAPESVVGDAPMFIPSTIKPEGVDVQIDTPAEESAGAGVSEAASALRRFRKGAGQ